MLGLEPVTYLQPCKDFRACVEHAFKANYSLLPEELVKQLGLNKHQPKNKEFLEIQAQKIIGQFDEKPTFNEFKQKLINSNFTFPEQLIKRAYEHMQFKKEDRFVKTFERIKRSTALPPMPPKLGAKLFKKITKKFGNIKWGEDNLNHFDLQIALLCLAIEARDHTKKQIEISPHICLTGSAGKGKTLLGKMLYPTSIASLMTNDSQGVGQLQLGPKRKMFKMDDLPAAILRDHKIAASIKSMYHNDWSAKIHGSKENNNAAAVFITTNEADPLLKLSDVSDLKAIERRFVVANISELEKAPVIDRLYSVNRSVSDDIIIEILRDINSKLHTRDCHKSLQVAKDYVCAFSQAILLDEERTPDEGSSHIEGGSVPHRGATLGETSVTDRQQPNGAESNSRDPAALHSTGNSASSSTKKRKHSRKESKERTVDILPKKKARLSSKKDQRMQRTTDMYEDLTEDELDTDNRSTSGELRKSTENPGTSGILMSALALKNENSLRLATEGMERNSQPENECDEELLAFAAEIELGEPLRKLM